MQTWGEPAKLHTGCNLSSVSNRRHWSCEAVMLFALPMYHLNYFITHNTNKRDYFVIWFVHWIRCTVTTQVKKIQNKFHIICAADATEVFRQPRHLIRSRLFLWRWRVPTLMGWHVKSDLLRIFNGKDRRYFLVLDLRRNHLGHSVKSNNVKYTRKEQQQWVEMTHYLEFISFRRCKPAYRAKISPSSVNRAS